MSDPVPASETVVEEPAAGPQAPAEDLIVEDELLIEDVSIDGMCGVY